MTMVEEFENLCKYIREVTGSDWSAVYVNMMPEQSEKNR